jgi:omega-6 fatty acid desaturase (delta-12 desaturase)
MSTNGTLPRPSESTTVASGLTKSQYLAWREQLSFSSSLGVTVGVLLFDAAMAAAAIWMIFVVGRGWPFWTGQALLALFYFHNFAIMHEAGHGNVHRRDFVNVIVGHYASLFCFLPFYPWRYIHHEHHTWTGNPEKDPTMKQILRMKTRKRIPLAVRFTWRSWIPFGAVLQHLVFWSYPITAWREGRMKRRQRLDMLMSILFLAAGLASIAAFAGWATLGRLWPSFVIYLVGVELVNFPHHLDMPTVDPQSSKQRLYVWEQQATTRSCRYPGILSELLVLNFNLHTEHHLFPALPWFRLKQVRELIKPVLKPEYNEVHGIGWNYDMRTGDLDHIVEPNYIPSHEGESQKGD